MTDRVPHILLVDDDQSLRRVLELQLDAEGYIVTPVGSAEEALSSIEGGDEAHDLVITDIRMPGMDGIALLEELKHRNPEAVVIVITAHGTADEEARARTARAFEFLTKPISREALLSTVGCALSLGSSKE